MIDLYTWTTPNGRKVSIALEELGLDYEVHPIDIGGDARFDPAFLAISPNNRIPAIVDRESGLSLMESGAILLYLADRTGRLVAPSGEARWRQVEWLMWQMGGLGPMAGQAHHFLFYRRGEAPYAEDRYRTEVARLYGVLERRLEGREHLAGDYSIADVAVWPWVARFERQEIDLSAYPNVARWYRTIAGRPAVRRGYDVPSRAEGIPMPR